MNILGLDTCFESCSVAVGIGVGAPNARVVARAESMSTGQAERLVPMMDEVMAESGLAFCDIDRIAVTTGPGTFTGMRIGISAARALAMALDRPIVTFTSLEVMAMSPALAELRAGGSLVIAADARRGQIYVQEFSRGQASACDEPRLVAIADAARLGGDGPIVFAGSGAMLAAEAARAEGRDASAMLPALQPNIRDVMLSTAVATPISLPPRPLYLRPPDAKPQDGKSLARAS